MSKQTLVTAEFDFVEAKNEYTELDTLKKRSMMKALEGSLGVITTACKSIGITRQTHYNWLANDPVYKKFSDGMQDMALDFAESQLHKQILDGNPTATIFFLKTKGRNRGYVERQELAVASDFNLSVKFID
jgi:hypothetical protein